MGRPGAGREIEMIVTALPVKAMNEQPNLGESEAFQQVSLLYLCFHYSFVMTAVLQAPHTWTSVEKFTCWGVCVFSLFLWASAVGTRRRAKLGCKEDTQGGEQVLVLSSLYTPARTEGCISEEIKGEWVMPALHRITCTWKATIFG